MRNTIGQSTLELTTTYSWALVIIAVFISAIIFYGTIDREESSGEEECRLGPQFQCAEITIDQFGHMDILFLNSVRDEIILKEIIFKNVEGNCPALPKNIRSGGEGKIQCYLDKELFAGDKELLEFELVFSDKDETAEFRTQSKIVTEVSLGEEVFDVDCDNDGDSADRLGCGLSNDCDDNDASLNGIPKCTIETVVEDCGEASERIDGMPFGWSCNQGGTCDAACIHLYDFDGDLHLDASQIVGGTDCNDGDANTFGEPVCASWKPCSGSNVCLFPGTCKAKCSTIIG